MHTKLGGQPELVLRGMGAVSCCFDPWYRLKTQVTTQFPQLQAKGFVSRLQQWQTQCREGHVVENPTSLAAVWGQKYFHTEKPFGVHTMLMMAVLQLLLAKPHLLL